MHYPFENDISETGMGGLGRYMDGMVYIEVSLIRIMAGMYQENWNYKFSDKNVNLLDKGNIFGLKLQF
jgi:hypothetical protein